LRFIVKNKHKKRYLYENRNGRNSLLYLASSFKKRHYGVRAIKLVTYAIREKTMKSTNFRFATENDIPLILDFIKKLAEYEKMTSQVVATESLLREWIFEKKKAEVIFALEDEKEVGFALFFHNFSTFLGRAGIYLEDLYVYPEYRGRGHGKGLIKELARIAIERGCGRLEWSCLDWNTPSIDFYLSLGAEQMSEWTGYRFEGESLSELAQKE
jgi:GNAT superfamily N-acetyltransferase